MSFFEDRDDGPRGRPGRRGGGGTATTDRQTMVVRRTVAAGVGLVVLVLIVLGVRGCLGAQKDQDFEDYVRNVSAITTQSNQESRDLFKTLSGAGRSGQQVPVENQLNTLRSDSEQLVDRARNLDHPDELSASNGYLVQTLEFRRDGISNIADAGQQAAARTGRAAAIKKIAAQMRNFDVSDVIYLERFMPSMARALRDQNLAGKLTIPKSQFLPDIQWLLPQTVSQRLAGTSAAGPTGPPKPGTHGTGIASVIVQPSGQELSTSTAADINVNQNISFQIKVENQGENDESNIPVKLTITGAGPPINLESTIAQVTGGQTATVTIPLAHKPPTGRAVKINVFVTPVPGEQSADNNKMSYPAIFTRG
jgi:hypothetical protein